MAAYDIELLNAWYRYNATEQGRLFASQDPTCGSYRCVEGLQLVVLMHDFEQFEPKVVQDLFRICRFVGALSPVLH